MKHLKRIGVGLVLAPLLGSVLFAFGDLMACGFSHQMPHPISIGFLVLMGFGFIYMLGEMTVG